MKLFLLFLFIVILTPVYVASQWEQIGWRGNPVDIHAQLGKTIYGKSSTGYYRSTDWGDTWKLFRKGLPNDNYMYLFDNRIHCKGSYISLEYGYQPDSNYYYAEDGDTTWKCQKLSLIDGLSPIYKHDYTFRVSNDTFVTLFLPPQPYNSSYQPGNYGVYFSSDQGKTWQLRKTGIPPPQSEHYYFYSLYKQGNRFIVLTLDEDSVTFKQYHRLYKSDNYGETWEPIVYPRQDSAYGFFGDVSDSLLFYSCEQTLYFSQTRGDSWVRIPSPLPDSFGIDGIYQYLITNVGKRIYLPIGVEDSSPQRSHREYYFSDDNTSSWSRFYPSNDDISIQKIFGYADTIVINSWLRTNSVFQGSTPLPISKDVFGVSEQNLVFVDGSKLFMVNSGDSISRSDDNGNSWTRYSFHPTDSLAFSRWAKSGNTIYAVGKDRAKQKMAVYTSTSNGDAWQQLSVLPELWDFDTLIVKDDTIIADHFVSTDHGVNWEAMSRPDTNSYYKPVLLSFGNGIVTVSQENGVYRSTNFGNTWESVWGEPESINDYIMGENIYPPFSSEQNLFFSTYHNKLDRFYFYKIDRKARILKRINTGFDDNNELRVVLVDKGVTYGVSTDFLWRNTSGNGGARHYKLVYSLDTGITWKQLGDSVMNGNRLFIGSDYLFLTGEAELWRLPLTTLSTVSSEKNMRSNNEFLMYPIPARNEVQITSQSGSIIEAIDLCDVMGKKVEVPFNLSESTAFADLRTVLPGYYIVRIKLSGKYYSRPLIVQK